MYQLDRSQANFKTVKSIERSAKFIQEEELGYENSPTPEASSFEEVFKISPPNNQTDAKISETSKQKRKGRCQSQVNKIASKLTQIESYIEEITVLSKDEELCGFLPKIREHRKKFHEPSLPDTAQKKDIYYNHAYDFKTQYHQERSIDSGFSEPLDKTVGQSIFAPVMDHLLGLFFSTLQYTFPMIDKVTFLSHLRHRPSYLVSSLGCLSARFSSHPGILAASKEAVMNRLFSVAKYEASSNYLTPTLELVQSLIILALHKFGWSDEPIKLSGSAVQACLQLGSHSRNDFVLFDADYEEGFHVSNLDRVWVFCLETDRVISLFYRRPMIYTADLTSGHMIALPLRVNFHEFPVFTWKLTLALRYLSYHALKAHDNPNSLVKFNICLKSIQTSLGSMELMILTVPLPAMKIMLIAFRSMLEQMVASVHLIFLCPNLAHFHSYFDPDTTQETYDKAKLAADSIYTALQKTHQYDFGAVVSQPPTAFYNYLIAGLFYKAAAFPADEIKVAEAQSDMPLTKKMFQACLADQLESHIRYSKIISIFNSLKHKWHFASKALQIIEEA